MYANSPEPSSEFEAEVQKRNKIYKLLATGFGHRDIEGILGEEIDWSFFSQETLDKYNADAHMFENKLLSVLGDISTGTIATLKHLSVIDVALLKLNTQAKAQEQKGAFMRKIQRKRSVKQLRHILNHIYGLVGVLTIVQILVLLAILFLK